MDNGKLSQPIEAVSAKVAELDKTFFSLNRESYYAASFVGQLQNVVTPHKNKGKKSSHKFKSPKIISK